MNLAAYDIVTRLDRKKTWIDPKYNRLYSREIKTNRNYFAFSKTYNPDASKYDINLILLDEPISGSTFKIIDKVGLLKKPTNITIKHIQHENDGDIYKLIF